MISIFFSISVSGLETPIADGSFYHKPLPTWVETKTPLSSDQALQQTFTPQAYPSAISFSDKTFWHKLSFPINVDEDPHVLYLKISNYMIDNLNFYLFHGEERVQEWVYGDTQEWNTDKLYDGIWIPIQFDQNRPTHLLIRRQSNGPILFPISFYNESNIEAGKKQQHTFWVIAFTSLTILLLYNIVIYLLTRVSAFIYYVSFNIGLIVSLGMILGFGRWFLPNEFLFQWLALHLLTLHTVLIWAVYRFSLLFLNLKKHHPIFWVHRFKVDASLFGFVIISYFLTESTMAPIFLFLQIMISVLCAYWAFYTKSTHTLATKLYIFSWGVMLIGALIGSGIYWNLIPYNGYTEYSFLLSSIIQLLGFSFAFSARVRQSDMDRHLHSLIDSVSGLPNRQFFLSQLDSVFKKARKDNRIISLVLIRLADHHTLSQAVGPASADNAAGQAFLEINKALMTLDDIVKFHWVERSIVKLIRIGSSNCLFLTYSKDIDALLTKLMPTLEKSIWFGDLEFKHSINMGIAQYPLDADNVEKLFQNAQLATEANQHSQNDWTAYDRKLKSDHKNQLNILSLLNRDLKHKKLSFHVQPQVSLIDKSIVGAEVLLRWHNHELGHVSPALFIPLAEKTGLILKITQFIIQEVFLWISENPSLVQHRHVSINISAKDLLLADFSQKIIAMKKHYNIPASNVILEVTETSIFEDNETFRINLSLLRQHGFNFSIDDFGTGYSSMHNVIALEPVEIKIDRMFVQDIDQSKINYILSNCIIDLCERTRSQSTAEGIETVEEMQTLQALSCQVGQGYLFHKPMPPENYLALLNHEDCLSSLSP
ncbi:EAL domain-containing protein [Marinomonas algicola]|uniref:EAL domain-containing protein n=1 Tax=Marinomonas algicola TaxID=2773454 RepID=UPI00174C8D84|nr:EAL domain-containing protein [Marinomonas algicola]